MELLPQPAPPSRILGNCGNCCGEVSSHLLTGSGMGCGCPSWGRGAPLRAAMAKDGCAAGRSIAARPGAPGMKSLGRVKFGSSQGNGTQIPLWVTGVSLCPEAGEVECDRELRKRSCRLWCRLIRRCNKVGNTVSTVLAARV